MTSASVAPGSISDVEWFFDEGTRVELQKLQAEIDRWNLTPGAPDHTVLLVDRPIQHNPRVFKRGNPRHHGRRHISRVSRQRSQENADRSQRGRR